MSNKINILKVLEKREKQLKEIRKRKDNDLQNTNDPDEITKLDIELNELDGAIKEYNVIISIILLLGATNNDML